MRNQFFLYIRPILSGVMIALANYYRFAVGEYLIMVPSIITFCQRRVVALGAKTNKDSKRIRLVNQLTRTRAFSFGRGDKGRGTPCFRWLNATRCDLFLIFVILKRSSETIRVVGYDNLIEVPFLDRTRCLR